MEVSRGAISLHCSEALSGFRVEVFLKACEEAISRLYTKAFHVLRVEVSRGAISFTILRR